MCEMNHSYVWRDSFLCVTWCVICEVLARHVEFIHGTCLFRTCGITHSYMWYDICVTWPGHRTSSKFARLNHHFPASAEGVVLPIDEIPFFIHCISFFLGNCGGRFLSKFRILEMYIKQCADYCLWSTARHFVKFVNIIRWNTL